MIKIILDTNFLVIPHIYKIDIFHEIDRLINREYEILVPSGVLEELRRLKNSKGENKISARVALQLIKKKCIKIIQSQNLVDEFILNFAVKNRGVIVCTNDAELRKRLKELDIPVISMRGESRLDFC